MASNLQRLGDTLAARMKQTSAAAVPLTVELGTINSNLSLTTDGLMATIPKGDYMVNLMCSGSFATSTASAPEPHAHTLRGIRAGDRVLVAWCGNEPVVLAVVVGS